MISEEEFNEYRLQEKKQRLKRARHTAIAFGICAILAQTALVYSFFQQTQANKLRIETEVALMKSNKEIEQLKAQFERSADEGLKQYKRAEEALSQLKACKKSNKK